MMYCAFLYDSVEIDLDLQTNNHFLPKKTILNDWISTKSPSIDFIPSFHSYTYTRYISIINRFVYRMSSKSNKMNGMKWLSVASILKGKRWLSIQLKINFPWIWLSCIDFQTEHRKIPKNYYAVWVCTFLERILALLSVYKWQANGQTIERTNGWMNRKQREKWNIFDVSSNKLNIVLLHELNDLSEVMSSKWRNYVQFMHQLTLYFGIAALEKNVCMSSMSLVRVSGDCVLVEFVINFFPFHLTQ